MAPVCLSVELTIFPCAKAESIGLLHDIGMDSLSKLLDKTHRMPRHVFHIANVRTRQRARLAKVLMGLCCLIGTMPFSLHASTDDAVLAEILEDSVSSGGAANANGSSVGIVDLFRLSGVRGVLLGAESGYQSAIYAEANFSNPPSFDEIQLLVDTVNDAKSGLAPSGLDETALQLWLDASDIDGDGTADPVLSEGLAVNTWVDKSNKANDAGVHSGQSAASYSRAAGLSINELPVLEFNRTNATLGSVYAVPLSIRPDTHPQLSVFTVYKPRTAGSGVVLSPWGIDNGGWDRFYLSNFPYFGGSTVDGAVGDGGGAVRVDAAGVVSEDKIISVVFDHGVNQGSSIYLDGRFNQAFTDGTHLTNQIAALSIGWDGNSAAFDGAIAEMIVYGSKLNECEVTQVNDYLAAKYGFYQSVFSARYADPSFSDSYHAIGKADGNCALLALRDKASSEGLMVDNPSDNTVAGAYLGIAHNGLSAAELLPSPVLEVDSRLPRVWRSTRATDFSGAVDVSFDLSTLSAGDKSSVAFHLLLNTASSDMDAAIVFAENGIVSGDKVVFTGVVLQDGAYVTLGVQEVDTARPAVALSLAEGQSAIDETDFLATFQIAFSETIDTTTFECADVVLAGTASGISCDSLYQIDPHDGSRFEVSVHSTDYGTVTASVPESVITDLAGNNNTSGAAVSLVFRDYQRYLRSLVLEDSAPPAGQANADGVRVSVAQLSAIDGLIGVNANNEVLYHALIALKNDFSDPPELPEIQAIVDEAAHERSWVDTVISRTTALHLGVDEGTVPLLSVLAEVDSFPVLSQPLLRQFAAHVARSIEKPESESELIALAQMLLLRQESHPVVYLRAIQGGEPVVSVQPGAGPVTVEVLIDNPDSALVTHYSWQQTPGNILALASEANPVSETIVVDPTTLLRGSVLDFRAQISRGALLSTARMILPVIVGAAQSESIDSDGDGVLDSFEGRLEASVDPAVANVLQTVRGNDQLFLMQAREGITLRLGASARAGRVNQSVIQIADILMGPSGTATPTAPAGAELIALFDFEAATLPSAGASVDIVLPLDRVLPAAARYLKYHTSIGWQPFVEDGLNTLSSAPVLTVLGQCPDVAAEIWSAGLTEGHACVRLSIEDGGPNDADRLLDEGGIATDAGLNGNVVDPGAIVRDGGSASDFNINTGLQGIGALSLYWLWTLIAFLLLTALANRPVRA